MIKFILKTLLVLVFILIAAVIGVYFYAGEIVKKAVADAKHNAKINKIKKTEQRSNNWYAKNFRWIHE